jgi:formylglycine-generating enzyme required for sulfatase activity
MGRFEVTQAQWEAVMGSNPSNFRGADLPVEQVSWADIQDFLAKLNATKDGYRYRLPREAEWEYAARAETTGKFAGGALDDIAWYSGNSGSSTHPVGQKQPNAWGLYDMLGNVAEWVQESYGAYPNTLLAINPAEPFSGYQGVGYGMSRGGRYSLIASYNRVSSRWGVMGKSNSLGFRCARERLVP